MNVGLIRVRLESKSPFAIAAPEAAEGAIDRPVSRDPDGRPFIPGSSVAGNLRRHLSRHRLATTWMSPERGADELEASRLWILGAHIAMGDGPNDADARVSIVEQTAIDPRRASAHPKTLRTSEQVLPGCFLTLYLRADGNDEELEALVEALATWKPLLGGGTSLGLGRFDVVSLAAGTLDLSVREDLKKWLTVGGTALHDDVVEEVSVPAPADDGDELSMAFSIKEGLRIGGDDHGDIACVYRRADDSIAVEGASLKGILRSRVGFILRSAGLEACFGDPGDADGTCAACRIFGSPGRRGRFSVDPAVIDDAVTRVDDHTAIDRISGGAARQRLWNEEVVETGTLRVKIRPLPDETPEPWMWALLEWALKDIADGYVGVGARTTRGLGTLESDSAIDPRMNLDEIADALDHKAGKGAP